MKSFRGAAIAAALVLALLSPQIMTVASPDERPPAELRTSSGKCVRSLVCPDGQTQEAGGLHPIGAAWLPPPVGGGLLSDDGPASALATPGPPKLRLKCGEFDPVTEPPRIPSGLTIDESQGVYIVQFDGPILAEQSARLGRYAELLAYIPDYAYAVCADPADIDGIRAIDNVRYIGMFEPGYKIDPALDISDTSRVLTIVCFRSQDIPKAARDIAALGAVIRYVDPLMIRAETLGSRALRIAFIPQVQWIEEYHPPQFDNGNAARITKVRSSSDGAYNWGTSSMWSYNPVTRKYEGYAGANFTAAVADTGIDGTHPGFTGKKVAYYAYGGVDWFDYYGGTAHGTHTAGTVLGNGGWRNETNPGPSYGRYAGMAPLAGLVGQMAGGYCTYYDLCHDAVASGASVSSNSWGGGASGAYDATAQAYDYMVRDARDDQPGNQSLTICFSAGNSGPGIGTIDPPASGKNVIAVGAVDDSSGNNVADFSSRGPCVDGRIKPDIVAPGVNVNSAWGNSANSYHTMSGTSMSCPVVAGASLIVYEYYCITRGSIPSPAMVKNILINGADALSGYPYPGGAQGWGRLNVAKSLLNTTNRKIWTEDQRYALDTGVARNYVFNITTSSELKISLVWTDVNGTVNANPALVNDLDLRVTAPNGTIYYGNFFNNSFSAINGTADWKNNVEVVRLAAPALGQWRVSVKGRNVPFGPQDYTLVIGGAIVNVVLVSIDLAAKALTASPTDPAEGDMVTFSASIENTGALPQAAIRYQFQVKDSKGWINVLGGDELTQLPVGNSLPVTINWTAVRGCYTVSMEVDPFSVISEDRIDNNVASLELKVRGYGLELSAPELTVNVVPGSRNDFQLVVHNLANTRDNFSLIVDPMDPASWNAGTENATMLVEEGINQSFQAYVTPPPNANAFAEGSCRIRVTSQGNSTYSETITIKAIVVQVFSVNITAGAADVWVRPGTVSIIPFTVHNAGNGLDSITLSLSGVPLGWQAYLSESFFILPSGWSVNVSMTVVPPSNAPGLSVGVVDVMANFDNGRTKELTVSLHVLLISRLALELADGPETEDAGGNASYVLRVKNLGNSADPFEMSAELPDGWSGDFSNLLPVKAGDFSLVDFSLSVPHDAPAGEQEFKLTAISGINKSVISQIVLSISVNQLFGVELSSDQTRAGLELGNFTRFEARVNNTGNGEDIIYFESEDSLPRGWKISFIPAQLSIPAGGSAMVQIKVRPPANGTEDGYFFSARAISSGDSMKAASLRFRIDLSYPPPEVLPPPVNNTPPPRYTGPPPSPPRSSLTTWLRSNWFLPLSLMVLITASVAAVGVSRSRKRKRMMMEVRDEPSPEAPQRYQGGRVAPVSGVHDHAEMAAEEGPAPKMPAVTEAEPAMAPRFSPLSSEESEGEIEVIDMGPPLPAPAKKTPPPVKQAAPPPEPVAAAPRAKASGKTVDTEIDDILSRIDAISKKR